MLILLKLYFLLFQESAQEGDVTYAVQKAASLLPPSNVFQGSNSSGQARTADVLTCGAISLAHSFSLSVIYNVGINSCLKLIFPGT